MLRHWDKALFVLGLLFILFMAGVVVGRYKYYPYPALVSGWQAVAAVRELYLPTESPVFTTPRRKGGVTRWNKEKAQDGITFISRFRDGAPEALLLDMEGNELHRWRITFSEVFPDAPHIIKRAENDRIGWHGAHLFPNGDVLFNFEGGNFPFGSGLVLIDKDSKVKWKLAENTHHDLDVLEDGTIFVANQEFRREGVASCNEFMEPPYYEDQILEVSPDGKVLDTISLLRAICEGDYWTLLLPRGNQALRPRFRIETSDPLHLNNVEVVTPDRAAQFPMAEAGDILVSLRDLNLVAFLDGRTKELKWAMPGPFVRQHDPDLLPNGNLLVFDNLGSDDPGGRSRILEIDPKTQRTVWSYEGTRSDPFDSLRSGVADLLPNGNVLVTESWGGRVFEVTRTAKPEIVWEFVNLEKVTEEGGIVGGVGDGRRLARADVPFLAQEPALTN